MSAHRLVDETRLHGLRTMLRIHGRLQRRSALVCWVRA